VVAALTSWFLSQGLATILGFVAKMFTDYLAAERQKTEVAERTRLEDHNRQLEESVRIQQQLADQAAKRVTQEDSLKRLEEGSA
jgi:hypothetical protein